MADLASARRSGSESSRARPASPEGGEARAGLPSYLGAGGAEAAGPLPAFLQRSPHGPVPGGDGADDGPLIQPKLEINAPGDAFEAEADGVADRVSGGAGMAAAVLAGRPATVQRKCSACAEAEAAGGAVPCPDCAAEQEGAVQRKETGAAPRPSAGAADAVSRPGAGAPMDPGVRARIEPQLGRDLSDVRVHDDARSRDATASIGAKAFTHRNHIWLGPGQSASDAGLMAHEATHTAQQAEGGAAGPGLIQRAPADNRHPEDGAGPESRMNEEIEEEVGDEDPPDPDEPKPEIDEAEKAAQAEALKGPAKPDADRPAAEAPKVDAAAAEVEAKADQPGEPVAAGQGGGEAAPPEEKAADGAGAELNAAQQAMAEAAQLPVPPEPPKIETPEIVAPVNADGEAMVPDFEGEARVQLLAGQLQATQDAAHAMRLTARQEKANAALMRGNIALVQTHVAEAEGGLGNARSQLDFRRSVIEQSESALGTSEEKAATVAAEAPDYAAEAGEAAGESGPMASEAAETSAEAASTTPDDPEAAESNQEQAGQMSSVSGDSATMDQAVSMTATRAGELAQDAAAATAKNEEARGQIDEASAAAEATDTRIGEMEGEAQTARGAVEAVAEKPQAIEAEADRMDAEADAIGKRAAARAAVLASIQTGYQQDAARVPGTETLAKENRGTIQRTEDPAAPEGPSPLPRGYEGRRRVDLRSSIFGEPELTEEQRAKQAEEQQRAQERRAARLSQLEEEYGSDLDGLSGLDKAGIALGLMRDDLFGSVSEIGWPDFSMEGIGHALIGIFDPTGPLEGVLSGLSKVASGALNLFDGEQWARDPLGNLLKSAADIATGITVILGSIVALAGVVMAIMAAVIVATLGWATPVCLPVITFCGNVMVTVGGWTISVGLLAAYYQSLLFIKNLVDAMTAQTAEELLVESEQMTEDTKQAGEIAMQVGTATLAVAGGAQMSAELQGIRAVEGAAGRAAMRQAAFDMAETQTLDAIEDAVIQGALGEEWGGIYGIAQMGHGLHGAMRGGGAPHGEGGAPPPEGGAAHPAEAPPRTPETPPPHAEVPEGGPPPGAAAPADAPAPAAGPEPAPRQPEAEAPAAPAEGAAAAPEPARDAPAPDSGADVQPEMPQRPVVAGEGAPPLPPGPEGGPARRPDADAEAPAARPEAEAAPARHEAEAPRDPAQDAQLRQEAAGRSGEEMTSEHRAAEAAQFAETPAQPVESDALREMGFEEQRPLDNGLDYVTSDQLGASCRIANTTCGSGGDGPDPERPLESNDLSEQVDAALSGDPAAAEPGPESAAPEAAADSPSEAVPPGETPSARSVDGDAEGTTADRPAEAPAPAEPGAQRPADAAPETPSDTPAPAPDADAAPESPQQSTSPDSQPPASDRPHQELSDADLDSRIAEHDAAAQEAMHGDVRLDADGNIDPVAKELRWERYQRSDADPKQSYDTWSAGYDRLVESHVRGIAEERAALSELGLTNNNAGTTETIRPEGETRGGTRPDSSTGAMVVDPDGSVHIIDVKSVSGERMPDGSERVVYDTDQIRQQRDAAHGREYQRDYMGEGNTANQSHAVIISSPDPSSVRPSRPLGEGSMVIHRTPPTGEGQTGTYRVWLPDPSTPHGGWWSPEIPMSEVLRYISRGT
ncbi:DUF4157 domain-containing protein [Mangrovicoccus sp. HB161399]|uniref:eCIS core domain-containing protein n=1 Tax=Mangrovicoccus sp. HB161399 TaxID=2720392 RepID=UPI001551EDAC|nr:DUF4157 domain-containing protein [Mangrovicoccus sp. HB161399]